MFILTVLLQLTLASSFIVSKALLSVIPPLTLVGFRMTIGGLCLLMYTLIANRTAFYVSLRNMVPLCSAALFGIFFTNSLESWGLRYTIAAKAYFIFNLSPFFAALLGYMFFKEKMTRYKWLGLFVGFFGFIPLIFHDLLTDNAFFNSLPELALLGAAAATVVGWISKKKLVDFQHYSVVMANGVTMFFGGLLALLISFLVENPDWNKILHLPYVYILFTINVTLTCIVGYNLYGFLLKRYSATYTTFSGFLGALFAALLGWIFLGEVVTWAFWVAFIIVALGVGIFHREEKKRLQ